MFIIYGPGGGGGGGVKQRVWAKISRPIVMGGRLFFAYFWGGGAIFFVHYFCKLFFAKVTLHVL